MRVESCESGDARWLGFRFVRKAETYESGG